MRLTPVPFIVLLLAVPAQAETGPCTEAALKDANPPAADDVFMYMPPYGKPVIGKPSARAANANSFSNRTNITRSWLNDHRIIAAPSGDMAYEYGTLHMGYDENGKHTEFDAVMLTVFRAKDRVCQIAAHTMQPLEQ